MRSLDLALLRAFLEVGERGTVAAAAAALGYTPPAVSQQLSRLEDALSTTLFDRVGNRLRLSGAGAALVPLAEQVLERAGLAPPPAGRIADNRSLLAFVAAGHGVTIVPELVLRDAPAGVVVCHEDLGMGRRILAVTRATPSPAQRRLLEALARPTPLSAR